MSTFQRGFRGGSERVQRGFREGSMRVSSLNPHYTHYELPINSQYRVDESHMRGGQRKKR